MTVPFRHPQQVLQDGKAVPQKTPTSHTVQTKNIDPGDGTSKSTATSRSEEIIVDESIKLLMSKQTMEIAQSRGQFRVGGQ